MGFKDEFSNILCNANAQYSDKETFHNRSSVILKTSLIGRKEKARPKDIFKQSSHYIFSVGQIDDSQIKTTKEVTKSISVMAYNQNGSLFRNRSAVYAI